MVSYEASGNPDDLATALVYWNVLLDDYQKVGDGAGGDSVVTHDTGYAMRTFAPYAALAYDWLHDAPGVTETLRAHARARFAAWMTFYTSQGYLKNMPAANYQAGYLFGATMIAIAEGGEAGAAGDAHWATVRDVIWGNDMAAALAPGGVLEGGDWPEGWQYGPLSVLEYALSARAMGENGLPIANFGAWTDSLALRFIYALTPVTQRSYPAGDFDSTTVGMPPMSGPLVAVIAGPASDTAKSLARKLRADLALTNDDALFDALADAATGASSAYPTTSATNYLAAGSGNWYARGAWSGDTVWSVFQCSKRLVADHQHNDAGNWVLTRGGDDVIVDPSPYGSLSSLTSNAPAIDSSVLPSDYEPSQADWGEATRLDYQKQTQSGIAAARCDYADQFRFVSTPSDISSALRDFVMIPNGANGTVVIVDRVVTGDPSRLVHLRMRTPGELSLSGDLATATVGGSALAIKKLYATQSTTNTREMPTKPDCWEVPMGKCESSRLPSGSEYRIDVSGPSAFAIHVVDAGPSGAAPPASDMLSGAGYRGALVKRDALEVAVITNDAANGVPGASLSYRVPASADVVHVVFDAPSGSDGQSDVSAVLDGTDCAVSVTPHSGGSGGFDAKPLIVHVAQDCGVTLEAASPPPTGVGNGTGGQGQGGATGATGGSSGVGGSPGNGGTANGGTSNDGTPGTGAASGSDNSSVAGNCTCANAGTPSRGLTPLGAALLGLVLAFRRRRDASAR